MNQSTSSIATEELLLSSSMSLFLKYGVRSVSMDDIARLLGISKKTIYAHIRNKKELVKAAVQIFIKQEHLIIEGITQESDNAIDEMVLMARQSLKTIRNMKPTLSYDLQKYHPETWKYIEEKHFKRLQNVITLNIERGIKEGFYRTELNSEIIGKLYLGLAKTVTTDESLISNENNLKEYYESMIIYHLHGIMNPSGKKELTKYLKNETI